MSESQSGARRPEQIHIIVMGSKRKKYPIDPMLHIGAISGTGLDSIARTWIQRLVTCDASRTLSAQELYTGERWAVVRRLPETSPSGEPIRIWVCSAGYGFIPADAPLCAYAATLAPGYEDTIPGDSEGSTRWWQTLSRWEGPSPGEPRSIAELVECDRSASFMLALSPPYLTACGNDIAAAVRALTDPNRLLIVSAGARRSGTLAPFLVPADARLQSLLGGTRLALNIRILAHLLSEGIHTISDARNYLAHLLANLPPVPRYERRKLSDREVVNFITEALAHSPGASASQLLSKLRKSGCSCEQHRFGDIYGSITKKMP